MTKKVTLSLLHLELVVSQVSKRFPDQLIMLGSGFSIEGTTVQELTLSPGILRGGCTHKQIINIGAYRGRQVSDAVGDHSLVYLWTHFHPHWQDVPLKHSPRGTESRQRTTFLRVGHLVEPIFKVEDDPEMVPMRFLEEVLNDRWRAFMSLET